MTNIVTRPIDTALAAQLVGSGLPPFLARIYAARGIRDQAQLDADLKRLIPPERLRNVGAMAALLADAIASSKKLLIVADYDADGATAGQAFAAGKRELQPDRSKPRADWATSR